MSMKRFGYILSALPLFALLSCVRDGGLEPLDAVIGSAEMAPAVRMTTGWTDAATRSLIDQETTMKMEANFLRIDETVGRDYPYDGQYTFEAGDPEYAGAVNWEDAYLLEASVISSPDAEGRRSVYLNPVQTYATRVIGDEPDRVTKYYHTRMVSWYPRTCIIHKDDGEAAITKFRYFNDAVSSFDAYDVAEENGLKTVRIRFPKLDGETDVMVSDVVEAQQWHENTGKYLPYREPFGHNDQNPAYDNPLVYKHFLSAVKVYAYTEQSEQHLSMWGRILKVVVREQPTECLVSLPCTIDAATGRSGYGQASFSGNGSFSLVKTPMFGNDTGNAGNETAEDNPTLEGATKTDPLYLGYALVAPSYDLVLDIHTDSGIYSATLKNSFEAGTINKVVLDFQTSGNIAALVLNDDIYKYYDLTTGKTYSIEGSDEGVYAYKYSNCYIIHPGIRYDESTGRIDASGKPFDGFCFLGTVAGNGDSGIMPGFDRKSSALSPVSAGIVWESEYGLIKQVELMYGYVRFRVDDYADTRGNAVIAVFDADGKVLWSWHIWITDSEPGTHEFSFSGTNPVKVMDRNLGAYTSAVPTDASSALDSYGLYYQWGRKDPSMPPASYDYAPMSTQTADYYDGYGSRQQSAGVMNITRPLISDGVENPMYLILPADMSSYYQYDWLYSRVDNLWGEVGELRKKTIYDPCPDGYWVPGDHLNTVLASYGGLNYGNFGGTLAYLSSDDERMFLPYAGYKGVDRGMSSLTCAWKYVGQKGDYMSAKVLSSGHRSRVYVSKQANWVEVGADGSSHSYAGSYYYVDGANRRAAGSVRCVADTPFGTIQARLVLDRTSYFEGDAVGISYEGVVHGNYSLSYKLEYGYTGAGDVVTSWSELSGLDDGRAEYHVGEMSANEDVLVIRLTITSPELGTTFVKQANAAVFKHVDTSVNLEGDALDYGGRYVIRLREPNTAYYLGLNQDGGVMMHSVATIDEGVYDHAFEIEEASVARPSVVNNYRTVGSGYLKHSGTGKYLAYDSSANSWNGGVTLVDSKEAATAFFFCSDWGSEVTDQMDIIDQSGRYLYTDGSKLNLWLNNSFGGRNYKWIINRVKPQTQSL